MSTADQKRIAELEAALAVATAPRKLSVKHSAEKGTVSVYGLRARFPVSCYPGEWDAIFAHRTAIEAECKVARPIAEAHRAAKRNA